MPRITTDDFLVKYGRPRYRGVGFRVLIDLDLRGVKLTRTVSAQLQSVKKILMKQGLLGSVITVGY